MKYIILALSFCFLIVPAMIGFLSNDFIQLHKLEFYFGETLLAKMGLITFISLLGAAAICVFYLYCSTY